MITREQSVKAGGDYTASVATGNFGAPCTEGNLLVVTVRDANHAAAPTISDTLGTTYTLAAISDTVNPTVYIFWGQCPSTGTNAVTATWSGLTFTVWVHATEYAGSGGTWSVDTATGAVDSGGTTDLQAPAISTTVDEALVVLATSQFETYPATYTAGADFTLVDGEIWSPTRQRGGIEDRVTSATLSSYVGHITSTQSIDAPVVIAAFVQGPPVSAGPVVLPYPVYGGGSRGGSQVIPTS